MDAATPWRERQTQQLRTVVLEAVIAQLESSGTDDVSMAEVARSAGISLRTLYRYFPDRASLLHSAGEYLYRSLGVPMQIARPEDIVKSFQEASGRLASRSKLTRALIRTSAGQVARSAVRRQRIEAIRTALKPVTAGLDADTAERGIALITHLCGATSWVSIADESGLGDSDAQAAVSWAIDALIDTLRRADRPHGRHLTRSRKVVAAEK